MSKTKFLIGQQVLLNKTEIGTVVISETGFTNLNSIWVYAPSKGYSSEYAMHNVKSLRDGGEPSVSFSRAQLAAMAMQGLCANPLTENWSAEIMASYCFTLADAMLKQTVLSEKADD